MDADGVLHGTGRYSTGTTGDQWIGTWRLSETEYSDFILELEFQFENGGKSGRERPVRDGATSDSRT